MSLETPYGRVIAELGSVGLLLWRLRVLQCGHASLAWPVATGRVEQAHIDIRENEDGRRRTATVCYRYEVDGTSHASSRLRFGSIADGTFASVLRELGTLSPGLAVPVFYDAKWPSHSVLIRGVSPIDVFGVVLLAGFLCWSSMQCKDAVGAVSGALGGALRAA